MAEAPKDSTGSPAGQNTGLEPQPTKPTEVAMEVDMEDMVMTSVSISPVSISSDDGILEIVAPMTKPPQEPRTSPSSRTQKQLEHAKEERKKSAGSKRSLRTSSTSGSSFSSPSTTSSGSTSSSSSVIPVKKKKRGPWTSTPRVLSPIPVVAGEEVELPEEEDREPCFKKRRVARPSAEDKDKEVPAVSRKIVKTAKPKGKRKSKSPVSQAAQDGGGQQHP